MYLELIGLIFISYLEIISCIIIGGSIRDESVLYKLKILESFMNLGQKKAQKIGMLTFQNDKIRLRNCKGDTNYGMD